MSPTLTPNERATEIDALFASELDAAFLMPRHCPQFGARVCFVCNTSTLRAYWLRAALCRSADLPLHEFTQLTIKLGTNDLRNDRCNSIESGASLFSGLSVVCR